MKEYKITEGRFTGKTVVFETDGTEETVLCPICHWTGWQIFYIKDYTEKDIGRECPECGNKNLKFVKTEH